MNKNKHLTLDDRLTIERELFFNKSFKEIGRLINKDCTTISKEIKNHIKFKNTGSYGKVFNNCINRNNCNRKALCNTCTNSRNVFCKNCVKCRYNCNNYKEEVCAKLTKAPYVCNGCKNISHCSLTKRLYDGAFAHREYSEVLKETRSGITINEDEITNLNNILVPLICEQGQSIHQAYINNKNKIMFSEKTLYKLIDLGLLEVRNIDPPREVRFRERQKKLIFIK